MDYFTYLNHNNTKVNTTMEHKKTMNTEEMLSAAALAGHYIVGSLANNNVSFSTNPVLHATQAAARAECLRLARISSGKTFFYVKVMGGEKIVTEPSRVTF